MPLEQREDDKPAAVERRIEIFLEKTLPLLDYYARQRLVSEIDGVGTIEEIFARILGVVGQTGEVKA